MAQLIHQTVENQATERPHAVAIVDGDVSLTYGELDRRANHLARALLDAGTSVGDRVALMDANSAAGIVVMLASLKIGAVYLPIDPSTPAARIRKTLNAATPAWLFAAEPALAAATEAAETHPTLEMRVEPIADHTRAESDERISGTPNEHGDAYLLFTSGSTGEPKGVPIGHHNVMPLLDWARDQFQVGHDDRHSGQIPFHFDPSVLDIWGTFHAGAQLHLVPRRTTVFPTSVAGFIRDQRLTQWFSVPSLLSLMAARDVVGQGDFPDLRRLHWIGEAIPRETLRYLQDRLPHVEFANLYGPTETTVASTCHIVGAGDDEIPLGDALPGEGVHILDDDLQPVATGTMGSLYISGVGLSRGYWRDEAITARAFIDPPTHLAEAGTLYRTGDLASQTDDGRLLFHGRADRQVKVMGYRIELDDIAATIRTAPSVDDAAVVAVAHPETDRMTICAAVVPEDPSSDPIADLKTFVADHLPSYMAPTKWEIQSSLPLNPSGKVDHPAISVAMEKALKEHAS